MERIEILFPRLVYIFVSLIIITAAIIFIESTRERVEGYVPFFEDYYVYGYGEEPSVQEALRDIHSRIVFIDPGHGGIDGGVVVAGVMEKDIVLAISLMVYDLIRASDAGIYPILSRREDVFVRPHDRADAGSAVADMIVSVHLNSFDMQSVYGTEVYFDANQVLRSDLRLNMTSRQLAEIMQRNIVESAGSRDRGARNIHDHGFQFVLTTAPDIPSVILELGYLTNPAERARLVTAEYQMLLAIGIYNGIREAFGIE